MWQVGSAPYSPCAESPKANEPCAPDVLRAAGIRAWRGPEKLSAAQLMEGINRGELRQSGGDVCDH